jgi:hypothetical protein
VSGAAGSVQTAESVFAGLDPGQQQIAQQVFLRLTALGEGTEDTRRQARMVELLDGPDTVAVRPVSDRLVTTRLVTIGEGEVQVAHEAVIRYWPRLRGWLTDDRDMLHAHRRLTQVATEWDLYGRDEGLLYRGARLATWDTRGLERLNTLERAFLTASRRRRTRERAARRRQVQLAATSLICALIAVSLLAATALAHTL